MMKATKFLAVALAGVLTAGAALADCDLAEGEKQFKKCKACHKLEDGANGVGPNLFGIVGRQVASVEGFKYSGAMTEFGAGKVWDAELLDQFLAKPKDLVNGTKMSFAGFKKEDQREAVVCYLATVK